MKKILMGSILLSSLLFLGCSSKEVKIIGEGADCNVNGDKAPDWVCQGKEDKGFFYESGSAEMSKAGFSFTRTMAIADARSNLSQRIEILVKDKVETYVSAIGSGETETVDKVSTHVSKQVSKATLKGSSSVVLWRNKERMFVLVKMSKDSVAESTAKAVDSSFGSEDALWQEYKSKHSLEELEKEFK